MPIGVTAGTTGRAGSPFVAVANYGSSSLSLYPVVRGKLGKRVDVAVPEGPTQVAVGDLNGNGENEIAVVCLIARKIEILSAPPGKPDDVASYAISKTIDLPEGSAPADLRISDLNGDGKSDLVVADFLKNALFIYLQQRDGSLSPQPALSTSGSHPNGLTVADLDGDGTDEIIVANRDSDSIDIFQWGDSHFQLVKTLKTADDTNSSFGPIEVVVLDVNGSGALSLAASHMRSNTIKILSPVNAPSVASKVQLAAQGQTGEPFSENSTFCYPNPSYDGKVKIHFTLEGPTQVNLQVFDVRGESVWGQTLSPSQTQEGVNLLNWDGVNQAGQRLASGLYLLTITVGDKTVTKKVALIH